MYPQTLPPPPPDPYVVDPGRWGGRGHQYRNNAQFSAPFFTEDGRGPFPPPPSIVSTRSSPNRISRPLPAPPSAPYWRPPSQGPSGDTFSGQRFPFGQVSVTQGRGRGGLSFGRGQQVPASLPEVSPRTRSAMEAWAQRGQRAYEHLSQSPERQAGAFDNSSPHADHIIPLLQAEHGTTTVKTDPIGMATTKTTENLGIGTTKSRLPDAEQKLRTNSRMSQDNASSAAGDDDDDDDDQ
eukprot:Hpha_TRINITY_DN15629_c0_g3::TRINITY_DN15629_c0_g3_i1::g.99588::m.99588